jgi:hypothetical protein
MTRLNLDLTTRQINILLRSLDLLLGKTYSSEKDCTEYREIIDIIRYIDKQVFVENK